MTANKDLKRLIRRRMIRTGESYTAARRHFLGIEDSRMSKQTTQNEALLGLSIDQLSLTVKATRALEGRGIERIGQLVERLEAGIDDLGLDQEVTIQIREVLASRGL